MSYKKIFLLVLIIALSSFLRLYRISENPPSLYWDEASLGYNAYSILKSGTDEHGEVFPLARFIAFGDYKPPGYIYASVIPVSLFGLTEFAVRFPSVFAGITLTFITYLLGKEVFKKEKVALLASFLIAVSPWSLQLSRGAFEANLAACLNAIAVLFFLKFERKKPFYLFLSVIFFVFSFYTFNANRLIAPLLVLFFSVVKFSDLWASKKWVVVTLFISLILLFPSLSFLRSPESRIRFQEVSIFTNLKPLELSNERIALHDNSLVGRLIHNRRIVYLREFLKHMFDHFRVDYLFISGDRNPRLSIQSVGELLLFYLPFLIIGFFFTLRNYGKSVLFLFFWIVIGLIPASVAKETPHALRTASILPVYELFTAYGLYYFMQMSGRLRIIKTAIKYLLVFLFIANLFYYLHNYYIHYPVEWFGEWQYGYKQAVLEAKKIEDDYDHIVVTEAYGRPYIYFLFYEKIDPGYYQATRIAERDWFGFWKVDGFGKYRFGFDNLENLSGKILVIGTKGETAPYPNKIKSINSPSGNIIFQISSL